MSIFDGIYNTLEEGLEQLENSLKSSQAKWLENVPVASIPRDQEYFHADIASLNNGHTIILGRMAITLDPWLFTPEETQKLVTRIAEHISKAINLQSKNKSNFPSCT